MRPAGDFFFIQLSNTRVKTLPKNVLCEVEMIASIEK